MDKVKVRIAVAVDPRGNWNCAGWRSGTEEGKMSIAAEDVGEGEARYWVEAELDIPEVSTVQGQVSDA